MGPTVLFAYLKIILLQCFQFLIFNFQQNKRYPNIPLMCNTNHVNEFHLLKTKRMRIVFYGRYCLCFVGTVFNQYTEIGLIGANAIPHGHVNIYMSLRGFIKLIFFLFFFSFFSLPRVLYFILFHLKKKKGTTTCFQ